MSGNGLSLIEADTRSEGLGMRQLWFSKMNPCWGIKITFESLDVNDVKNVRNQKQVTEDITLFSTLLMIKVALITITQKQINPKSWFTNPSWNTWRSEQPNSEGELWGIIWRRQHNSVINNRETCVQHPAFSDFKRHGHLGATNKGSAAAHDQQRGLRAGTARKSHRWGVSGKRVAEFSSGEAYKSLGNSKSRGIWTGERNAIMNRPTLPAVTTYWHSTQNNDQQCTQILLCTTQDASHAE